MITGPTVLELPDPERLPSPIANVIDELRRLVGAGAWLHAAIRLRDAFELTLRFAATIAVASRLEIDAPGDERLRGALGQILSERGASFGMWGELLRSVLAGVQAPPFPSWPATILGRMRGAARANDLFGALAAWRNDTIAHGALRRDHEYRDEMIRMVPRLGELLACLPPLVDGTLQAVGADGRRGDMRGPQPPPLVDVHSDHEEFGRAEDVWFAPPEDAGYIGPLRLGPWMQSRACAVCGLVDVFFFDRFRKSGASDYLHYFVGHKLRFPVVAREEWAPSWERARALAAPERHVEGLFDAAQERLLGALEERTHRANYIAPDFLVDRVRGWLAERDRGYLHVVGAPGTGKTFFMQGLRDARVADLTLSYGIRSNDRQATGALSHALGQQLVTEPGIRIRLDALHVDSDDPRGCFLDFFATLLHRNGLGSLLLVLDGLDEQLDPAPGRRAITDLLPDGRELPVGFYIVVASRPQCRPCATRALERLSKDRTCFERLEIDPGDHRYRALVRRLAERRLAPRGWDGATIAGWCDEIIQASDGTLLDGGLLASMVAATEAGPPRPFDHRADRYASWFERVLAEDRVPALLRGWCDEVLEALAIGRGPLSVNMLSDVCALPRDYIAIAAMAVNDVLRIERRPELDNRIALFHDTLREHLAHRQSAAKRAELHRRFARVLLTERLRRPEDDDHEVVAYRDDFTLWHVAGSGDFADGAALLLATADAAAGWPPDRRGRWLADLATAGRPLAAPLLEALSRAASEPQATRALPEVLESFAEAGLLSPLVDALPAIEAGAPLGLRPQLKLIGGFAREHTGDGAGAIAELEAGLAIALRDSDTPFAVRARLRLRLGKLHRSAARLARAREFFDAVEQDLASSPASASANARLRAELDYELGYLDLIGGRLEQAETRYRRSVGECEAGGDHRSEAYARGLLARVLEGRDRLDEALEEATRAEALAARLGLTRWRVSCLSELGSILTLLERWEDAEAPLRESLALCERMEAGFGARTLWAHRARLARWQGRIAESLDSVERARRAAPFGQHVESDQILLGQEAATLVAAGRHDEAVAAMTALEQAIQEFPMQCHRAFHVALRAEIGLARGDATLSAEVERTLEELVPSVQRVVFARDLPLLHGRGW